VNGDGYADVIVGAWWYYNGQSGEGRAYVYHGVASNPPVSDAGGPYSTQCSGQPTTVQLDGTDSSDPDGDPLTYAWTTNCTGGSFNNPSIASPILSLNGPPPCSVRCNVTLTVTDSHGVNDSDTTTVTVYDSTPPSITCPGNVTLTVNSSCQATYSGPAATASDNCDSSPTINSNPVLPATFIGAGPHTVTWTATDDCWDSATCTQTVTLRDLTPPVITCPANVTLTVDASCQATYSGPAASATDNCGGTPTITSSPVLPATFTGAGAHSILWTATDASGNTATCTQTVTLRDLTPPAITCPANVTLTVNSRCQATYSGPLATATDN
jgi:hypothetical protein